jgi:precorrin-6x reductase
MPYWRLSQKGMVLNMGNKKILLFGGTTEARIITETLVRYDLDFTLSVATDFGKEMAAAIPNISSGRLSGAEIENLLAGYGLVIDATHPYAVLATKNIRKACENTNTKYFRVLREPSRTAENEGILRFSDNLAAVEYLNAKEGNILLTTGSKDAADFTAIENFAERVFVRMLPLVDALTKCLALGFKNSHLICLQGNFTKELNVEIIKMIEAKYIVTKDSGKTGGFFNKLAAGRETGAKVIVISRPHEEAGVTLSKMLMLLKGIRNGDVLH